MKEITMLVKMQVAEENVGSAIQAIVAAGTSIKNSDPNAHFEASTEPVAIQREILNAIEVFFTWEMQHKNVLDELLYAYYTLLSIEGPTYLSSKYASDIYIFSRELLQLLPVLEKYRDGVPTE